MLFRSLHKGAQEELEGLLGTLEGWLGNEYRRNPGYPGHSTVADAKNTVKGLLDLATSPSDFLQAIAKRDTELEDLAEDLEDVRTFFNGQAPLWDRASKLAGDSDERDYLEYEPSVAGAYMYNFLTSSTKITDFSCGICSSYCQHIFKGCRIVNA